VGRAKALLGALLEAVVHDPLEPRGNRPAGCRVRLRGVVAQDRRERLGCAASREGAPSRQHLEQHRAEGEEVAPRVDGLAAHLLRAHVADRAEDRPPLGRARLPRGERLRLQRGVQCGLLPEELLGQPEVEDLEPSVLRHPEVVRLEVAVDHPFSCAAARPRAPGPPARSPCAAGAAPAPAARAGGDVRHEQTGQVVVVHSRADPAMFAAAVVWAKARTRRRPLALTGSSRR